MSGARYYLKKGGKYMSHIPCAEFPAGAFDYDNKTYSFCFWSESLARQLAKVLDAEVVTEKAV